MIAYVIKNKEGKFWQFLHNDESEFVDEIYNAFFHYSKQDAEKTICSWSLKDCKVVGITIEEVNKNLTPTNYDNLSIEDKLKYRENQVRIALDRDIEYNDKITELEFTIKRLEEELAEKDKEIEHLKDCNESLSNKFDKESDMQNKIYILKCNVEDLRQQLAKKGKMVDIACGKLVDFEYEQKESVHSAQFWKERLEALAKRELERENSDE